MRPKFGGLISAVAHIIMVHQRAPVQKINKLVIALIGTFSILNSSAQTVLPPITVSAYSGGGDFGSIGGSVYSNPAGMSNPMYAVVAAFSQAMFKLTNVRCSATGRFRDVTSMSEPEDRWLAAEMVFREVKQLSKGFGQLFGITTNPLLAGGTLTVVYADGGTEVWNISSAAFSAALSAPESNSLKLGDGTVHPHPICN